VPDGYQKLVRQKMLGLINQNYYEFHNPTDLSKSYSNTIAVVLVHNANSFKDDLAELSKSADLDYIFVTSLSNISEDENRVMLKGKWNAIIENPMISTDMRSFPMRKIWISIFEP
jgi:hypothetical protein